MASFLYEGLILFGITLVPGALGAFFLAPSEQKHPLQSEWALQIFTFALYGIYFTWCWSKHGQTLPMQTWRIKLITLGGRPPSQVRAFLRYLLSWMWVAPAIVISWAQGWAPKQMLMTLPAGILIYAGLALLHPQRQFWHDAWCGTQLVACRGGNRQKTK